MSNYNVVQAAAAVRAAKRALANHLVNTNNTDADNKIEKQLVETKRAAEVTFSIAKELERTAEAMRLSAADHARKQQEERLLTHRCKHVVDRNRLEAAYRALLTHSGGIHSHELRDLISSTTGAAVIAEPLFPTLYAQRKNYARLLDVIDSSEVPSGAPTKIAVVSDVANEFTLLSETSSITASGNGPLDPSLTSVIQNFDTLKTNSVYSRQFAQDTGWSVDKLFSQLFGVRYWRAIEKALTTGSDANSNALPNNVNLVSAASVGTTTTALANGVGYADLVNLVGSLDYQYANQGVASFMFSTGTRTALLALKDSVGRPYFDELYKQNTLLGYNCVVNDSLPQSYAANGIPILFGSFRDYAAAYYTPLSVRSVFETSSSGVDLAATLQAEGIGYSRISSQIKIASAVKSLRLAAS